MVTHKHCGSPSSEIPKVVRVFLKSIQKLIPLAVLPASLGMAAPAVWIAPSLHRVGISDSAGGSTQAQLSAARGAYESFQIVVRAPRGPLTKVNVTLSDLSGPSVIPKSSFTLYREKFVYVSSASPNLHGSNQPLGAGWYPDALIPFTDPASGQPLSGASLTAAPFSVEPSQNQPVWVDLLVPRTAPAGQYSGTFTVTSDQGTTTGQVNLTVWNFTLPLKPSLKTAFLLWSATDLRSQEELLKHKIAPSSTTGAHQAALIDNFGLGVAGAGFYAADVGTCGIAAAPSVADFRATASAQRPGLFLYDYSAGEVDNCPGLYPSIRQWARNMHQAGLNNLVTMSPTPALFSDGSGTGRSAVDIWAMLPKMFDNAQTYTAQAIQKGDSVWSYNTLVQDAYSPKWEIDFDPVNFRIQPGFISQSLGLTGMLCSRVDRFTSDPWNDPNNTGVFGTGNYPGEGMLVYPGQQVGLSSVVPSMRLKWLRDGIEDYEYVQMLKDLGNPDLAMQIARAVGPDWSNWTRDANAILSARRQLGEAINQIVRDEGRIHLYREGRMLGAGSSAPSLFSSSAQRE